MDRLNITGQKKIVVTGPECSGKSTLAKDLSRQLSWPLVTEVARRYLKHAQDYDLNDLRQILRLQLEEERKAMTTTQEGIICDTDALTIDIWAWLKFGRHDLTADADTLPPDLYILSQPDFPVVYDPLREDAKRRKMLFDLYLLTLIQNDAVFILASGSREDRLENTLNAILAL